MRLFFCSALAVLLTLLPVAAEEDAPPHGDTYTPAELLALDRALHAANMTREDLTFRKDLTKGHGCLPLVREMLGRPLAIAEKMDNGIAALAWWRAQQGAGGGNAEVLVASDLFPEKPPEVADCGLPDLDGARDVRGERIRAFLASQDVLGDVLRDLEPEQRDILRAELPAELAWHDVFEKPGAPEPDGAADSKREALGEAWLHETMTALSVPAVAAQWQARFGSGLAELQSYQHSKAFPSDAPEIFETPFGRVALGTPGDDHYEGEFAFLVDPGGNDRYVDCRLGAAYGTERRRIGFFADLGGDDVYACKDVNVTLGAAVLGIAAFYDLGQGNDRYVGGHCSLGAAMGGVAVFYDDGGSDVYEGKTFTQGAAGFGIGIFQDDALQERPEVTSDEGTKEPVDIRLFDNDRLHAWSNAQAFARCRGVALCINTRGNEVYEAGGVYLHAPLFSDRYQSFSQGFAIGERNIDYAGGLAMLIDHEGNDRYLGDVYNQGVGYWYAAGLLWDGGGNDTYEMTQYGQGSGIHLAVGGLVDVSGHDTYVMHSGLGQGSSHDYAASILHDRAGNDRYLGNTSCNGAALTNSVGIHMDRAGNDTYAGRRKGSINFGRPARGFSSIGVLLDLDGQDDYLGLMKDDALWRHTDIGVGWDFRPPEAASAVKEEGVTPAADQPSGAAAVPEICAYEGALNPEVFDELWEIATRWEVGDNRHIVPKARERLIAFGPDVLSYLDGKVEQGASGLELRAYVDILKALRAAGHEEGVVDLLLENFRSDVGRRNKIALYLTGELEVGQLEEHVVGLLGGEDEALARRAAGVLASLKSHAGDSVLRTWLDPQGGELKIQSALGTLLGLEADVYADVRLLLGHPLLSVRTRLIGLLVKHAAAYLDAVRRDLMSGDLPERARRSLLEVLVRTVPAPDAAEALALSVLLEHPDWGMRADAVRLVKAWEADVTIDRETIRRAVETLNRLAEEETDPYVRFCLEHEVR